MRPKPSTAQKAPAPPAVSATPTHNAANPPPVVDLEAANLPPVVDLVEEPTEAAHRPGHSLALKAPPPQHRQRREEALPPQPATVVSSDEESLQRPPKWRRVEQKWRRTCGADVVIERGPQGALRARSKKCELFDDIDTRGLPASRTVDQSALPRLQRAGARPPPQVGSPWPG